MSHASDHLAWGPRCAAVVDPVSVVDMMQQDLPLLVDDLIGSDPDIQFLDIHP